MANSPVATNGLLLLLLLSVYVALPCLGDCAGGSTQADWLACRSKFISAIFNRSTLPSRDQPDYIIPLPTYAMYGFPGPGNGVGNASGNSWKNNMTSFVWEITSPFISLNSTIYYTLNTSGTAPRNWPQDGPTMPDTPIAPSTIGDTVIIYHNGHETDSCTPNFDGVVDYFNELGYDVMEMFMPLYGCNADTPYGQPYNHQWFEQWELKGDFTMRFFIEPVVLTVNYALKLGYKHVVLLGLSGGGWTTTVTAAVDPRITLSIPIAGSVPKWATPLYPFSVPDLPEMDGDYEQQVARPMYQQCAFVCMYTLAALEAGRTQVQVLHQDDPCCYAAQSLHPEIKQYNAFVQSQPAVAGWMQSMATAGNIHQVNLRDKVVATYAIEKLRLKGVVSKQDLVAVPFDVLQVQQ